MIVLVSNLFAVVTKIKKWRMGMASLPLTEAEADRIIATEKQITGDINWEYDPAHNQAWAKFEKEVENGSRLNLVVYGNTSLVIEGKASFSLILNGNFRVFSLDVNGSHRNKHTDHNEWRGETHKQRWTDLCRSGFAYTPNERIPSDVNAAFREFCRECNIDFPGRIRDVPVFQSAFGERQ